MTTPAVRKTPTPSPIKRTPAPSPAPVRKPSSTPSRNASNRPKPSPTPTSAKTHATPTPARPQSNGSGSRKTSPAPAPAQSPPSFGSRNATPAPAQSPAVGSSQAAGQVGQSGNSVQIKDEAGLNKFYLNDYGKLSSSQQQEISAANKRIFDDPSTVGRRNELYYKEIERISAGQPASQALAKETQVKNNSENEKASVQTTQAQPKSESVPAQSNTATPQAKSLEPKVSTTAAVPTKTEDWNALYSSIPAEKKAGLQEKHKEIYGRTHLGAEQNNKDWFGHLQSLKSGSSASIPSNGATGSTAPAGNKQAATVKPEPHIAGNAGTKPAASTPQAKPVLSKSEQARETKRLEAQKVTDAYFKERMGEISPELRASLEKKRAEIMNNPNLSERGKQKEWNKHAYGELEKANYLEQVGRLLPEDRKAGLEADYNRILGPNNKSELLEKDKQWDAAMKARGVDPQKLGPVDYMYRPGEGMMTQQLMESVGMKKLNPDYLESGDTPLTREVYNKMANNFPEHVQKNFATMAERELQSRGFAKAHADYEKAHPMPSHRVSTEEWNKAHKANWDYAEANKARYADQMRSEFMSPANQEKLKERYAKMDFSDYLSDHEKSGDARGLIQGSFKEALLSKYPMAAATGGLSQFREDPNHEVSRAIEGMANTWPGTTKEQIWDEIAAQEKANPINKLSSLSNFFISKNP